MNGHVEWAVAVLSKAQFHGPIRIETWTNNVHTGELCAHTKRQ